jgi:membrane fusion protein (multidrug efflux system)
MTDESMYSSAPRHRRSIGVGRVLRMAARLFVSVGTLTVACSRTTPRPPEAVIVEVSVQTVRPQTIPMTSELTGRTAAFAIAEIRPQVGGIVLERLFTEGGDVRAGQVLYRLDPSSARTTVASAEAALAKAQASLPAVRERAVRYRELVEIEAVSKDSLDEAESAFHQAEAEVAAAKAALETARLPLAYANVTSPISGRIGRSSVSRGALVTADQTTALATVQQLDPIYVDATRSVAELLRVRRQFAEGRMQIGPGQRPKATLVLEDGSAYQRAGQMLLTEAIVDDTAGSVVMRAQFPNPDRQLMPGMFVRMTLEGAVADQVLTVPQAAVTRDAKGNALVFVVGANDTIEQRSIVAAEATGDRWVVDSGVKSGERVVTEGLQKIRAGIHVKATEAAAAAPPAAAPVAH